MVQTVAGFARRFQSPILVTYHEYAIRLLPCEVTDYDDDNERPVFGRDFQRQDVACTSSQRHLTTAAIPKHDRWFC